MEEQTPAIRPAESRFNRRTLIGLGLATGISGGAFVLAKRQGLGDVGGGGMNQKLLPHAGQEAPDVVVTDILGDQTQLSNLRGGPVWLNFWGSWCPPCRAEMPEIEAAYQQLGSTGIKLLAISLKE